MGELLHKKGFIYLSAVFILLLAVLYVYLIQPIRLKTSITERKLATQHEEYSALQAKLTHVSGISDADRIQLEAVRRQVPEQPYIEAIVRDLRRLEVVSQTQLKQYDIKAGSAGSEASSSVSSVIPIQIDTSFVGTYAQIYQLFAELESLDRLIQVDKVSFNLKQGPLVQINAPNEPIISNLTLTAYYSPILQSLLKKSYDLDFTASKGRANPFN